MANEVKLYAVAGSPFVCRAKIALNLKGIKYENVEESLANKSPELLKYNPVHKKVPVLLHNGNPICESLVIIEYIDEVWKGTPILPEDPYEKAMTRFWAKFIDDKCLPAIFKAFSSKGEEQAVKEALELLQILENELKGKKFYGGDTISMVDIAADFIGFWLGVLEEVSELTLITKDKFPNLTEWIQEFLNVEAVKISLPPRANLVAFFRTRFGKA